MLKICHICFTTIWVVAVAELWELSGTLEVDQELETTYDKGKGLELAPEPMMGQGLQKCDSCEHGVEGKCLELSDQAD